MVFCSRVLWVSTSGRFCTTAGITGLQHFLSLAISVPLGSISRQTVQDQIITLGAWRGNRPHPMPPIRRCVALLGVIISHCKVNLAPISSSPGGTSEQCAMKQWYPLGTFLPPLSLFHLLFFPRIDFCTMKLSAFAAEHTHTHAQVFSL